MIASRGLRADDILGSRLLRLLGSRLRSGTIVPYRVSWLSQIKYSPLSPAPVQREVSFIDDFFGIRGNPFSAKDLMKYISFTGKKVPSVESVLSFLWSSGYHRDLDFSRIFAEVSDPSSNPVFTNIVNENYVRGKYTAGYPRFTGQSSKDREIINKDWICTPNEDDSEKHNNANIKQVTEEMEDIEDNNNEIDVDICRNKAALRLLLYAGPKVALVSQVVVDELQVCYQNKGDFFISLLEDDQIQNQVWDVIVQRLRQRARMLYIKKIETNQKCARDIENTFPKQRAIHKKVKARFLSKNILASLRASELRYPVKSLDLLQFFFDKAISESVFHVETISSHHSSILTKSSIKQIGNKIVAELKNEEERFSFVSYEYALCIYSAALLLTELCNIKVVDPIQLQSLKLAIHIGMTDPENHGFNKILKSIIKAYKKRKSKNEIIPFRDAILEVAGLSEDMNIEKADILIKYGFLVLNSLKDLSKQSPDEQKYIKCQIGKGKIGLYLSTGCSFEFNLSM